MLLIGWQVRQASRLSGYMSCLASVESELERKLKADELTYTELNDEKWKFLSESEADDLLDQVWGYDCSSTGGASPDAWGRNIRIALRNSNGLLEVRAWSGGPDGEFSTSDDLVFPYGRDIPK